MIANNDVSIMNDSNTQTMANINNLQKAEAELFVNLERGISDKSISLEQQKTIVQKINEISQMRVNLYKNLNGQTGFYADNITNSIGTLQQQKQAIYITENELNESKRRLALIEDDKNNKMRLIEINTYYADRYGDYAEMMKTIVIVCIPLILLAYLSKLGLLPTGLYMLLLILVVVFIVIYMFWKIYYLNIHDNMNYQEYNWGVNTSKYPKLDGSSAASVNPWSSKPATCSGASCCLCGSTFDSNLNRCVPNSMSSCPLNVSPAASTSTSSPASLLSSIYSYNLTI